MKQQVTLGNPTNNELVTKILAVIGSVCTFDIDEDLEGESDARCDFEFPETSSPDGLLILGDNAWGAVTGAWMDGDNLILSANYGDDGDCLYCPTITEAYEYEDRWVNPVSEDRVVRAVSL